MAHIPTFHGVNLRAICDVLGDTSSGLTGSEIGQLLHSCGIDDPDSGQTKRHRLFSALDQRQHQDSCGNNVVAFIHAAMNPVRYTRERELFESRQSQLNQVLAFCGYEIGEDGKLREATVSRTLSDAQKRANRLYRELLNRNVHADVLRFCRAELVQDDYFHAVFEATKSVADKIRDRSGLTKDGALLVDEAFGLSSGRLPVLAFNTLRTETERSVFLSTEKGTT